jgi:hypothetical protein
MTVQAIPIELIRTDGGTQIRDCKTMQTKIDEYVLAMNEGADFPPLTVFWDGEHYWLADGFHRHGAYNIVMQALELPGINIPCEVIDGPLREAIIYACGANSAHGIPRTNPDKQNAVKTMLTNPLVSLDESGVPWTDREIARKCLVGHDMVGRMRAVLSGGERQITQRKARRGGSVYTINTGGINQGRDQGRDADRITAQPKAEAQAGQPPAAAAEARPAPEPAPEAPAKTAEVVKFTSPHDYLYDRLAEIDRAMAALPEPHVAAAEFPDTLAHALPLERVVEIKHWWLDFTRFWAAREPEFQRYQQRQRDFIREELNVNAH